MTILLVLCCAGDEFEGTWLDDERHGHGIEVQAGHGKFKVRATRVLSSLNRLLLEIVFLLELCYLSRICLGHCLPSTDT